MAELGQDVVGVDVDERKVAALNGAQASFFEPGFEELPGRTLGTGRLPFSTHIADAAGAQVHFICVGTPQMARRVRRRPALRPGGGESLLHVVEPGELVVGKSTLLAGTAAELARVLGEKVPGAMLAWNPEFLREGFAVRDTLHPDRLVYGVPDGADADTVVALLDEVYAPIVAARPRRS